jgi:hypothetical protein
MIGESNLNVLLKSLEPTLNKGDYVFCTLNNYNHLNFEEIIMVFKEEEGNTIILEKSIADKYNLSYTFIASWITLKVHSSLEGTGLTATFSNALAKENISCNVVAAFYHDHIFVPKKDGMKSLKILEKLTESEC